MYGCSQKLQYKHYNGKKQTEGEGGRINDNESWVVTQKIWKVFFNSLFSVLFGHCELHVWLCQPQTCKATVV